MKLFLSIAGTVLIIFGILGLSYKYISYTQTENVMQIGSIKVTADDEKVVPISPVLSVVMLGAGIVLVIVGVSRKV